MKTRASPNSNRSKALPLNSMIRLNGLNHGGTGFGTDLNRREQRKRRGRRTGFESLCNNAKLESSHLVCLNVRRSRSRWDGGGVLRVAFRILVRVLPALQVLYAL